MIGDSSARALREHIVTCSRKLMREDVRTDTSEVPQPPALGAGGAPTVGQPSTQREGKQAATPRYDLVR
eukprot:1180882-Prorocentrum_minimum.AAC.3